jgi:hypothetical protein
MDPWYAGPVYPPDAGEFVDQTPEEEKAFLQEQVGVLEGELKYIQERLAELEQERGKEKK